jgi:hypothetical protein
LGHVGNLLKEKRKLEEGWVALLRMRSMVRNVRDVFAVELYTNSAPHKESEYCKELLEFPNGMMG